MALALHLTFDEPLAATLTDAMRAMHAKWGGMDLLGRDLPPHLTLAIFDAADAQAVTAAVDGLLACSPLPLQLSSAGTFGGAEGVVFLAPVVTPRLLELHARIHAALADHVERPWPHYLPRSWVPHATLLHEIAADDVGPALAHARTLLPASGVASALEVIEADVDEPRPVQRLAVVPLRPPSP